ncbi:MAG: class I SAM-dependent methyltransferase [Methyloceanibacter sp.]
MSDDHHYDEINDAKATMDHIYDRADPRAYFRELKSVGYQIPGAAKRVFQRLIELRKKQTDDTVHILDLGCSYGINAALLKHDLSIQDLYDRWAELEQGSATAKEIIEQDADFFAQLDQVEDIEVIGLDVAENAVAYGEQAGLLDRGLAMDLESHPLPQDVWPDLVAVDLVTSTGCVGYVTEKSFEELLPAVTRGARPWFANFVLRMFPFEEIAETLGKAGFVTEKLSQRLFVQRKFASRDEQDKVLEQLIERGIDPSGKETEGHLLAELYLTRPRDEAVDVPIERLLAA